MGSGAIAHATEKANEQHYEVPAPFFCEVLGPRLKYSCADWGDGVSTLAEAEESMLDLTCKRAGLEDGMTVLDLGCGWGSLSLWIATEYPRCSILAVSNSAPQREFIETRARALGCDNLTVETADMNEFQTGRRFDRVISVEMFEHMQNWKELLRRIATWVEPHGRVLVHNFCHHELAYPYEAVSDDDWMARFFFTGGLMPCAEAFTWFPDAFATEQQWVVNGNHYARTCRAWLRNIDERKRQVLPLFRETYGEQDGAIWFYRWRLFFIACEELFRFRDGNEWFVTQTLLRPADP